MNLMVGARRLTRGRGFLSPPVMPSWVLREATLDIDFVNRRAVRVNSRLAREVFDSTTLSSLLTLTRASAGTRFQADGDLVSMAADTFRFDHDPVTLAPRGIRVEPEARTNVVLWNRDLTNAAWTKTNVTAAKDQTGIDGVANSASSITATAGNGTCLQAITLSSSARFQTAYAKRLVGTGAVEMTMDNGATWTPITVTSTTAWSRVSIPTQTLANPTVGFRLATSGDSIAVDYVQNENGAGPSSAIAVTTVAVPRAAETLTFAIGDWFDPTAGVWLVEFETDYALASIARGLTIDSGSTANSHVIAIRNGGGQFGAFTNAGGVAQTGMSFGSTASGIHKIAYGYAENSFAGSLDGAAPITDNSGSLPTGLTTGRFGRDSGGNPALCWIRRAAYVPGPKSAAYIQALAA